MWSRCWWATWLSGFFGIAGALHVVRSLVKFRLVIGDYEVPWQLSGIVGMVLLVISAGLLLLEVWRDRRRKAQTHGS